MGVYQKCSWPKLINYTSKLQVSVRSGEVQSVTFLYTLFLLQVASARWIMNALLLKGLPMTGFRWLSLSLMEVIENIVVIGLASWITMMLAMREGHLDLWPCYPPFQHSLTPTIGWSVHNKIMLLLSLLATLLPFLSPMLSVMLLFCLLIFFVFPPAIPHIAPAFPHAEPIPQAYLEGANDQLLAMYQHEQPEQNKDWLRELWCLWDGGWRWNWSPWT